MTAAISVLMLESAIAGVTTRAPATSLELQAEVPSVI
jgi:hypothetical protein